MPSDDSKSILPASVKDKVPTSTAELKEQLPSAEELKEDVVEATKGAASSIRSFAAGGVGGICAVIVGHPFDLVKVRLQTAEKGVYSGAIDVVKKTIAREGPVRVRTRMHALSAYSQMQELYHGLNPEC